MDLIGIQSDADKMKTVSTRLARFREKSTQRRKLAVMEDLADKIVSKQPKPLGTWCKRLSGIRDLLGSFALDQERFI